MQSATERRLQLLEYLCEKRHEKRANLMAEFGISKNTLDRDLLILQCSYPIYTKQGNGGGVYVVDGYYIGRKYLKSSQEALLQKLQETLSEEEQKIMKEILKTFAMPKARREG